MDVGLSLDLSKATKLRDLMFRCSIPNIRWITATLETLEFKNLQQITIRLYPTTLVELTEGANHRDLQDLDRMLVQLTGGNELFFHR